MVGAAFLFLRHLKVRGVRMQHMKRDSMCLSGWRIAIAIFALAVADSPAMAQARATGPHTTVSLLASRDSFAAGDKTLVGLHFQMEKGWHVYWENPGDSGEPPQIQWHVPAGFSVGAIEWPAPKKLVAPSIVDYGYENEVLLFAPLKVPADLRNGQTETIAANVNWLVCREMCIPGKARVSLTLPVNSAVKGFKGTASSAEVAELMNARAEVPKPMPRTWKVYVRDEKNDFVLTVETGKQESAATFFPQVPEQINNDAKQAATPFSRGVRLRLQKSDGLLKPIKQLGGVLELGSGRAYDISAPIHVATNGTR
ncbi:MAG TPA: protein-disulfide reductase DsbD domain-containing protein [Candidatus Acidoferrales bacterium]|nr:protein-disulfide reductase DsbD domain-containing protein [Candidatus Acidoferrales bacterium]